MKKTNQWLVVAGVAMLLLGAGDLLAQNNPPPGGGPNGGGGRRGRGGNFDPAQFQQQMMERVKERLEITKDDEWTAVEPLVQNLFDARRETMAYGTGGRGFGRRGGPRPGGDNNTGGQQNRRPSFFGEPSPETEALDKAIQSKASNKELKAAMEKFRAAKKASEAKVKDAQEALRKVLTPRQEAIAVANGWLD
jgi:hypothetical protein